MSLAYPGRCGFSRSCCLRASWGRRVWAVPGWIRSSSCWGHPRSLLSGDKTLQCWACTFQGSETKVPSLGLWLAIFRVKEQKAVTGLSSSPRLAALLPCCLGARCHGKLFPVGSAQQDPGPLHQSSSQIGSAVLVLAAGLVPGVIAVRGRRKQV